MAPPQANTGRDEFAHVLSGAVLESRDGTSIKVCHERFPSTWVYGNLIRISEVP